MIRKISESELPALHLIFKENIENPWSFNSLNEFFKDKSHVFLGYFDGGTLAGYAIFSTVLDEGEIISIATRKIYRKKGIGRMLLSEIINESKKAGVCRLLLEVRKQNTVARTFYENHGFKIIGTRAAYYSAPKDDAIIMSLDLC